MCRYVQKGRRGKDRRSSYSSMLTQWKKADQSVQTREQPECLFRYQREQRRSKWLERTRMNHQWHHVHHLLPPYSSPQHFVFQYVYKKIKKKKRKSFFFVFALIYWWREGEESMMHATGEVEKVIVVSVKCSEGEVESRRAALWSIYRRAVRLAEMSKDCGPQWSRPLTTILCDILHPLLVNPKHSWTPP